MRDMNTAEALLRDVHDHLNDDGRVVIACPDFVRWGRHFYDCDYTHCLPFTRRSLRQLLLNEGFELVSDTVYVGPIFGYRGLPLYWLSKLIYPQIADDLTFRFLKNDLLRRGFWTLLPNILMVARKRPGGGCPTG